MDRRTDGRKEVVLLSPDLGLWPQVGDKKQCQASLANEESAVYQSNKIKKNLTFFTGSLFIFSEYRLHFFSHILCESDVFSAVFKLWLIHTVSEGATNSFNQLVLVSYMNT